MSEKRFPGWKAFWNDKPANLDGVMLNREASELESDDRQQILEALPCWSNRQILELGAGIGRFTGQLADKAKHLTAVDFSENFVTKNRQTHQQYANITFCCADVMQLSFTTDTFDLVFSNWLLMYLNDRDVQLLLERIDEWLMPGGYLFIRESCVTGSRGQVPSPDNPAHYRLPNQYEAWLEAHFQIKNRGNVAVYQSHYNNPYQIYWIAQKA
jgi:phosphoethanolamine N-methyltransferase